MDKLKEIVKIYFQKVSSYNILQGRLDYNKFNREDFHALALREIAYLSDTEIDVMYEYLEKQKWGTKGENGLNVFCSLKECAKDYLMIRDNEPVCHYDSILEWRTLTKSVGEDLAICAFLAKKTQSDGKMWTDFEWYPVVEHDNCQLNCIMERGISDNHFHLFGSASHSKLIWIRLMNDLEDVQCLKTLQYIDTHRRQTRNHYSATYKEESLVRMRFQAALIRMYLFRYLFFIKNEIWDEKKENNQMILIQNVLQGTMEYTQYYPQVQAYIDRLALINHLINRDCTEDYANLEYGMHSINHEFEGERALMYRMLLGEWCGKKIPAILMKWFYAYLVIQIKFREEIVQVNDNVGFANFSQYQKRRSGFLHPKDNEKIVQLAVKGSIEPGNIRSLELRITPADMAWKNRNWILECDRYIKKKISDVDFKKIYYVFHFPKERDEQGVKNFNGIVKCRHYEYRNKIANEAEELIKFREIYCSEAARVKGVDACAQELDCRPEVFGTVFRQLSQHVVSSPLSGKVGQWKITYHVGEDWFDAVDGLRAIDEAILYLNMHNGDRLGHATVLGINIAKWYEKKKYSIWISEQDYLDNVVWLYHKLIEYRIADCELLKEELIAEFDRYFKKIYPLSSIKEKYTYTIDTYYESWKLRGDDPKLYQTGKYVEPAYYLNRYWVNEILEEGMEIRKEPAVTRLMYSYHYSEKSRRLGNEKMTKKISEAYIYGVEKVQKALQNEVAGRGISVETNPSSNYMISTIETYEDHPISKFYNLGLTIDAEELNNCPQIHASINTDDKGVFHTSLENEYALVANAMENLKKEDGQRRYKKQMVYDWIDRIRENGNQQRF